MTPAERADPLAVVCPVMFCKAAVGSTCVMSIDGPARPPHIARIAIADATAIDARACDVCGAGFGEPCREPNGSVRMPHYPAREAPE